MPKGSVNIYLEMKDDVSPVLTSISDKTKALEKETQLLTEAYEGMTSVNEPLIEKKKKMKKRLEELNKTISDSRKQWNKYNDEVAKVSMDEAIDEQEELRKKLTEIDGQIKNNQKAYREYQNTIRKKALTSDPEVVNTLSDHSENSLLKKIGDIGLADMWGDSLSRTADVLTESMLGQPLAMAVSSTLSGVVSGAAMGSTLGTVFGLPGMAFGALAGGAAGALSGGTQIFAAKDDAFKDYYGGLYDTVSSRTDETVESGSTIAGSREQTRKAFVRRFGDEEDADEYLSRVKTMAAGTNYDYDEIVGYSKLLLNSYDPDDVFGVLQSLSDATAGLSLSSGDVEMMINGLSRMRTTGKATGEYLNYFSERGVDVYQALADATGADKKDIAGMVTKGSISGETAAQAILDFIDKEYSGLSEDLMGTYDALSANLEDIMTNLAAAAGEGYNEIRKSGLEADQTAYTGALGEAMEEINRIAGENRAYLENLSGQYQREALGAVLMGEQTTVFAPEQQAELEKLSKQYAEAKESYEAGNQQAGLLMESYRESAEAIATAAYESSEQYLALKDTEMEQIEAIRENTKGLAAATLAYQESQERSKGGFTLLQPLTPTNIPEKSLGYRAGKHAYGLNRVPHDDYPALLHEGERVKTAAEAREEDREERLTRPVPESGTLGHQSTAFSTSKNRENIVIQVSVTGNTFTAAGEDLADQIASVIADRLEEAAMLAIPR